MYRRDVPLIREYVETKGPDGFLDVVTFVLCTIRVPFSRVKPMVDDVKNVGSKSQHLWGFKKKGYEYAEENKQELFKSSTDSSSSLVNKVETLLNVQGLGLPKASFVLQCLGENTGCLDTHNLKRFNRTEGEFKIHSKKPEVRRKKVEDYLEFTQGLGTEYLWDSWCNYIAGNRVNKLLPDGDKVSAYHYESISGDN